ncbi:MAG: aminotransferase class I/II-fold pyridoxal phosphate-dependent enzyme [Rhodocyclaceae bacterium]|nr:aminotransferase class I/II-fold pyridoxal phosphate-dependent enzyme [Rhodocyclaceae bacterium]
MSTPHVPSRLPQVGTTIFSVMSQLAQTHGAINLSQGFPDFAPPPLMLSRVAHHMATGSNQYAMMHGAPSLRVAIAEKVARLYGANYDVEREITVTAGATEAIFCAIAACVRPGDEVIVFAPVYDAYIPAILLNGGTPILAKLAAPDYRPNFAELRQLLTPRTRMVIINSPHNPTGSIWSAGDMAQLAVLLEDTNAVVVSDEVYEHVVFDAATHVSVMHFPALRERSFVVSSFGKTYHITGWKIAYCLAPESLMAELRKTHQFVVFSVSHPMQLAIADFMRDAPEFADDLASFYQQKRDHLRAELADSRFRLLPCAGTYFQLVDYSAISEMTDLEFAHWLTKEHGVASIPISVFSPQGSDLRLVRLCFAKDSETLANAGARLRKI